MNNDSFFSMDKLVEFGLGMAMAQQMVNVMNQSMQNMYIPGSAQTLPKPEIYYGGELMHLVNQGKVNKDTLCWMPGMQAWQTVEQTPAVLKLIALTPPPLNI